MLTLKNLQDIHGKALPPMTFPQTTSETIDTEGAIVLPGAIDPHVHFRIPGQAHKEDWETASRAAIAGGYTQVFDMPNNIPACVSEKRLYEKEAMIEEQLTHAQIPLRYGLYLGADRFHFDQIHLVKKQIVAIKVFMGSSTGDLLMDDDASLHGIFSLAAHHDLLVAVHAEDECRIQERQKEFDFSEGFAVHSKIRDPEVAVIAVEKAIFLAEMYGTRLYILHTSTIEEIALIQKAKARGVKVFAEVCPHHLFLNTRAYETLGSKAQMNPPLREPKHQAALIEAIHAGVIDTLGSDHAPHTLAEKNQSYGQAPSGVPGIETNIPLLLDAVNRGDLTLQHVKALTHDNVLKIFRRAPQINDFTIVQMHKEKIICDEALKTKAQWSPFAGKKLRGWPLYTIIAGTCFRAFF
jgi:dihydroorotase